MCESFREKDAREVLVFTFEISLKIFCFSLIISRYTWRFPKQWNPKWTSGNYELSKSFRMGRGLQRKRHKHKYTLARWRICIPIALFWAFPLANGNHASARLVAIITNQICACSDFAWEIRMLWLWMGNHSLRVVVAVPRNNCIACNRGMLYCHFIVFASNYR